MTSARLSRQIMQCALYTTLASAALVHAQLLTSTTTGGREFIIKGRSAIPADDVPDGRRFRGNNRDTLLLIGPLHMPAGNAAEHKLMKLVIHFHTGRNGPRLNSVAVGDREVAVNIDSGDFTRREDRNAVKFDRIGVDGNPPLRLTITFAGGIDSTVGDQEFVLTRVDAFFPLKEPPVTTRVPNTPAPSTSQPIPIGNPNEVIYTVSNDYHLMWARHEGMADGTWKWPSGQQVVGNGWQFKHVFSTGGGVIYVINDNGDLLWYHHDGIVNGAFQWASFDPKVVANGWNYRQVFAAGGGVIYAINDNGELLWFHHAGQRDGSRNWTSEEGKVVGTGWSFKRVFSGGDGVIYALTDNGELHWYRHDGRRDGSAIWAPNSGSTVGTGWTVDQIFSSGNGVIYIINNSAELIWFRHLGIADGSPTWLHPELKGQRVGTGWVAKEIFSGANLRP